MSESIASNTKCLFFLHVFYENFPLSTTFLTATGCNSFERNIRNELTPFFLHL